MIKEKENYGNDSIDMLEGADRVRLKPSVIFGSDGLEGCQHTFFEILSNSIDEAKEGFGNQIEIKYNKDKSIEVKDYGRGIPVDYNERKKRMNWELIFCELYAGGKFKKGENEDYNFSLGLNGLGVCSTQYASEFMDVEIFRDGYKYNLHFEKGNNIGGLKKTKLKKPVETSTWIKWKPDLEVFTETDISLDFFKTTLEKQAIINKGITFSLEYETEEGIEKEQYYYENGVYEYIEKVNKNSITPIIYFTDEATGKDRENKPEYKVKMEIALAFNNNVNLIEYYHNSSWLEHGGSPDKAVKASLVKCIDEFIKEKNKYNKDEEKIAFKDIVDSLIVVTNTFSTETSYENQTKKAINNKFIQEAINNTICHHFGIYLTENQEIANKIVDQILLNKRSRESSEKVRINIKKKISGQIDGINKVQKFVDCRTKDKNVRELYIVEGDSALGSCKLGRNAEFQAIMPVRGKILNCLKTDYGKIFESDIITDLIKVLGCGVEIQNKHNKKLSAFDMKNLRWNKIIICTDADVDGFQIRTLILTMLYRLTPTLIKEGKVFIAESPLYEINTKEETFFAFNEQEKSKILSKLRGKKYSIQRSKGLGENEPEMMWTTTMNPETRRLIEVVPEDEWKTKEVFDLLLGDNLSGRKDYINKEGHKFMEDLDVM